MGGAKASAKPSCAVKAKPPLVRTVPPAVQVQAPAHPVPSVPEEPADVSMKEEQELCRAFSEQLLSVQDVDEQDAEQPQLCSQYVKDIYRYLHVLEVSSAPPTRCVDFLCCALTPVSPGGAGCPSRLHAGLRDHRAHACSPRGLAGPGALQVPAAAGDSVSHCRRPGPVSAGTSRGDLLPPECSDPSVNRCLAVLQVQPVSRRKLQLVGVTSMLVACKYEEMYAPEVGDFAYITDNAFTTSQILEMEQLVLRRLNFQLGRPLPLHFLRRASKVAQVSDVPQEGLISSLRLYLQNHVKRCAREWWGHVQFEWSVSTWRVLSECSSMASCCFTLSSVLSQSDVEGHTLAKYLMELTLLDYDMVHYRPSEVAAAALCLSQLLLEGLTWVRLHPTDSPLVSLPLTPAGLTLLLSSRQSPAQQHYSTYDEAHLKPVMQHIAKNVVTVNEGKTKFQVSRLRSGLDSV